MKWSVLWLDGDSFARSLDRLTWFALMVLASLAVAANRVSVLTVRSVLIQAVLVAAGSVLGVAMLYALSRRLGSTVSWAWFSIPPAWAWFASAVFCLLVRMLALVLESAFSIRGLSAVVLSLVPFYLLAVFGWSVRHGSHLQSRNGSIIGAVGVLFMAVVLLGADWVASLA